MNFRKVRFLSILLLSGLSMIACPPPDKGEEDMTLLMLLLLSRPAAAARYCGDATTQTLQSSTMTVGGTAATGTISANQEHAYRFTSGSGTMMALLFGTSSTFDSQMYLCGGTNGETSLASRDQTTSGRFEFYIGTATPTYLLVGGFGTSAGSYKLKVVNGQVTGGGRCTGWSGSHANECLNYDVDFTNPTTHCASISGTYNASACAVAPVRGRCTTREFSPNSTAANTSSGFSTIIMDTTDQASDSAMQTYCDGIYTSGNYIYTSG